MKQHIQLSALAVVLTTAAAFPSACSTDDPEPEMQPATAGNGLPIPGNMMATMATMAAKAAATTAAAGRSGASATSVAGSLAASGAAGTGATAVAGRAGAAGSIGAGPAAGSGGVGTAIGAAGTAANSGASGSASEASAAGAAGAAGGPAANGGAGSAAPMTGEDPCGPGAMPVTGDTSSSGNGVVLLFSTEEAEIVSTTMDMLVPKKPLNDQTLFIWPGIQPSSDGGISGFGVLQPVLTWGGSCNGQRAGTWWISGQYVYFTGGFGAKCETGDLMDVGFGDKLYVEFLKNDNVWTQNVTNRTNNKKVTFDRDLKGQKQVEVLWDIEIQTQNRPTEDVIFTNSVIKLAASNPKACVPRSKGANDWFSQPRASADGKTCCIDKVILRAAGTMMTSPNAP